MGKLIEGELRAAEPDDEEKGEEEEDDDVRLLRAEVVFDIAIAARDRRLRADETGVELSAGGEEGEWEFGGFEEKDIGLEIVGYLSVAGRLLIWKRILKTRIDIIKEEEEEGEKKGNSGGGGGGQIYKRKQ